MALSACSGLVHLHTSIVGFRSKPIMAHRDLKYTISGPLPTTPYLHAVDTTVDSHAVDTTVDSCRWFLDKANGMHPEVTPVEGVDVDI